MTDLFDTVSKVRYERHSDPTIARELKRSLSVELNTDASPLYTVPNKYTKIAEIPLNNPCPGVPSSEWLKHLPSNWNNECKLRQIVVWMAESLYQKDKENIIERRIPWTDKIKEALIERLKSSDLGFSFIKCPPISETVQNIRGPESKEDMANVRYKRILEGYRQNISIINDEINRWEKCENNMYDLHSIMVDRLHKLKENYEPEPDQNNSFMKHIGKDQREYLKKLLSHYDQELYLKPYYELHYQVSAFRKTLNVITALDKRIQNVADGLKEEFALALHENSRIVPIDADKKHIGLFGNHKVKREKNEAQNIEHLLRHCYHSTWETHE